MRPWHLLSIVGLACGDPAPRADGTLDWIELDPMPMGRANHCSARVGDHLVVIGGNHRPEGTTDFVRLDAVHAAPLQPDGTLGAWAQVGTLPSPVTECAAAASGDRLFVVDGLFDDPAHAGRVWSAVLEAGGFGAFADLGPLPADRRTSGGEAWVTDAGILYVIGTRQPDVGDDVFALRADVSAGTLGAWTEDAWLPGWRAQAGHAFDGERVFTLGGHVGPLDMIHVDDHVYLGTLDGGGAVGTAVEQDALPEPVTFGEALAVDDYLFVLGGRPALVGAVGQTWVWSSHLQDGDL